MHAAGRKLFVMLSLIMHYIHNSLFKLQTPENTNFTQSRHPCILVGPQVKCSNATV